MVQYNPFLKNNLINIPKFTPVVSSAVVPIAINVWQTVVLPGALPNKTVVVLVGHTATHTVVGQLGIRNVGATVPVLPFMRGSCSTILICQTDNLGQIDIRSSQSNGIFVLQGFLN